MATPSIPPRPVRSQEKQAAPVAPQAETPKIPPRPAGRREVAERAVSQERYARSPLNDPSFTHNGRRPSRETAPRPSVIRRPPSINSLPLVGQEGNEYATPDELEAPEQPDQKKHISKDLPLHAPTAAVPAANQKARVASITRTDSEKADIATVSKLVAENTTKSATSPRSGTSSAGNTRPPSIYKDEEEHGIPSFGITVPMLKFAGDVQAPSPGPGVNHRKQPSQENLGPAAHRGGRKHTRTRSGRDVFTGPPGTYGMHGHQHGPHHDPMEQDWYQKHPEEAAREAKGEYGPYIQENRKDYHLSREKLDELVHVKAPGMGSSTKALGMPAEEMGYDASEEYLTRVTSNTSATSTSNRPPPIQVTKPPRRSSSQPHAESPLRKASFPEEELARASEAVANNNFDGAAADFGMQGGELRNLAEDGYGTPILASDEVAKHPAIYGLNPAVSAELERERRASAEPNELRKIPSRPHSRNKSIDRAQGRNKSIDRNGLARFNSREEERAHTPLDYVKEYEPLFPDDEDDAQKKPAKAVGKRPELAARHHFPSQDIWEDAPNHVYLETTVETPELPEDPTEEQSVPASQVFEKPEDEEVRKTTITKADQESFLADRTKKLAKTHLNADVLADMPTRPGMRQRFPSQDIWEDAPEHVYQTTTVDTPEEEETKELTSPVDEPASKPVIPARPVKATAGDRSPEDKKAPIIPGRPKPKVPQRPQKPDAFAPREDSPLAKVMTPESAEGADAAPVKQKPAVPARPGGSKLASLKAGFMSDLNSRLQLGPPKPKEVEKEEEEAPQEKAPLADARKGRAKGPSRRKPTASPSAAAASTEAGKPSFTLSVTSPFTVWSISDSGLSVNNQAAKAAVQVDAQDVEAAEEPEISEDTATSVTKEAPVFSSEEAVETAPLSKTSTSTSEHATQTGQMDVKIQSPDSKTQEFTTYIGGGKDGSNVVVNSDGNEYISGKLPAAETEVPIGQNRDSIVKDTEAPAVVKETEATLGGKDTETAPVVKEIEATPVVESVHAPVSATSTAVRADTQDRE